MQRRDSGGARDVVAGWTVVNDISSRDLLDRADPVAAPFAHEEHPMCPRTWEVDIATVNQWGPVDPPSLDH